MPTSRAWPAPINRTRGVERSRDKSGGRSRAGCTRIGRRRVAKFSRAMTSATGREPGTGYPRSQQSIHRRPLRLGELELENSQVFAHVRPGARSGERDYLALRQIPKQDLRRRTAVLRGQLLHRTVGEKVRIGGQRPEALIADPVLPAERADLAVVAGVGIKAILDDRR